MDWLLLISFISGWIAGWLVLVIFAKLSGWL